MNNQIFSLTLALTILSFLVYIMLYCTYKWLKSLPELIEAIKEYNKSKDELVKILKEKE